MKNTIKTIFKLSVLIQAITVTSSFAEPLKNNPLFSLDKLKILSQVNTSQVKGTVDMTAVRPQLILSQTIRNRSKKDMSYTINSHGLTPFTLKVPNNQSKQLNVKLPIKSQKIGKISSMVQVSPQLLINNITAVNPVKDYEIKVILPKSAKKIVKSNKQLISEVQNDGTKVYNWKGKNEYLTPLNIWWTNSDTDISLKKSVQVNTNKRVAVVSITVKNNGDSVAKNIILSEDFSPQEFKGLSNVSNGKFEIIKGTVNDVRLVWKHKLTSLSSGQSKRITYQLQIQQNLVDIRLYETVGLEKGEPISVSNSISKKIQ